MPPTNERAPWVRIVGVRGTSLAPHEGKVGRLGDSITLATGDCWVVHVRADLSPVKARKRKPALQLNVPVESVRWVAAHPDDLQKAALDESRCDWPTNAPSEDAYIRTFSIGYFPEGLRGYVYMMDEHFRTRVPHDNAVSRVTFDANGAPSPPEPGDDVARAGGGLQCWGGARVELRLRQGGEKPQRRAPLSRPLESARARAQVGARALASRSMRCSICHG